MSTEHTTAAGRDETTVASFGDKPAVAAAELAAEEAEVDTVAEGTVEAGTVAAAVVAATTAAAAEKLHHHDDPPSA